MTRCRSWPRTSVPWRRTTPTPCPGFVSLEGYLAGRMAIVGLERCGRDLSRTCFLNEILRGEPVDIDGFELRFGGRRQSGLRRRVPHRDPRRSLRRRPARCEDGPAT